MGYQLSNIGKEAVVNTHTKRAYSLNKIIKQDCTNR